MYFDACAKLASKLPDFVSEITNIDQALSACDCAAVLRPSILASRFNGDVNRIQTVFQSLESSGLLRAVSERECRHCAGLQEAGPPCLFCGSVMFEASLVTTYRLSLDGISGAAAIRAIRTRGEEKMNFKPEDLSDANIRPWSTLHKDDYLIECEKLGDPELIRVRKQLGEIGIAQIRLSGQAAEKLVIDALARSLGKVLEEQNAHKGQIKDIRPKKDVAPNTGDSAQELGAHVDGTQDSTTPCLLIFQYVTTGDFASESRFWDSADEFVSLSSERREAMFAVLGKPKTATFLKNGVRFDGPLISMATPRSAAFRGRFDEIVQIAPEAASDYEYLKGRFAERALEFNPRQGDVVVFDNWRLLHGRGEVGGVTQRLHRRMWIGELHPEVRKELLLGVRPLRAKEMILLGG